MVEGIVIVGGTNIGKRQNLFYTLTKSLCPKKTLAININRKITKTDAKDFVLHITGFKHRRLVFVVSLLAEEHFHLMALVGYKPVVVASNVQVLGGTLISPRIQQLSQRSGFRRQAQQAAAALHYETL